MTNKNEMPDLKPCPFCGGGPDIQNIIAPDFNYYEVACNNCGVNVSAEEDTAEHAIAVWNTRAAQPLPAEKQPQINTHKLNIHILLDALACAAKGEPIDPEQCEAVAGIVKEYNATDFTADDIQALYDCGPKHDLSKGE